jgi:hypothetical protein
MRGQRRVVCAALRVDSDGLLIITGARHYDMVMVGQMSRMTLHNINSVRSAEQGFIDQYGVFMDRSEAFLVATEAGQILAKSGNPDSTELFSEDIY